MEVKITALNVAKLP